MPIIKDLYVFVAEDKGPEDEGVAAFNVNGQWFPLFGADKERTESLKPFARVIAKSTGKKIKLLRFSVREEVEVIE